MDNRKVLSIFDKLTLEGMMEYEARKNDAIMQKSVENLEELNKRYENFINKKPSKNLTGSVLRCKMPIHSQISKSINRVNSIKMKVKSKSISKNFALSGKVLFLCVKKITSFLYLSPFLD